MTARRMLCFLSVVVLITLSAQNVLAQDSARWPPDLNPAASPAELMTWLDQKTLANARVGLNDPGTKTTYSYGVVTSHGHPSASAIFSNGFRLATLEGCHLTLKNTAVRILDFSGKRSQTDVKTLLENRGTATTGQLFMWMERLSFDKGKGPYRHTSDPARANLLGAWRTKFVYRGFFERDVFSLSIDEPGRAPMREVMTSLAVTFTFDDRETAEQFNLVFRRAIKTCQQLFPR